MKISLLTLTALFGLAAAPVLAETMVEDSDASGGYSIEELMVSYPELSEDAFAAIDVDGDGEVTVDELSAAREAGLIAS